MHSLKMKKILMNKKVFLLPLVALLLFPSCARYRKLQPIVQLEPEHFVEKNNIQVATKKLSSGDCKNYFGNKRIVKKYDVIQLHIKNKRLSPITLNAENISVYLEKKRKIYKHLSLNTTGRIFSRIILGTLLTGATLASFVLADLFSLIGPTTLESYCLLGTSIAFAAGAVGTVAYAPVAAIKNRTRNMNIKSYINDVVFGSNEELTIAPSETANKVIFVPKKQVLNCFDITISTQNSTPVAKFTCTV